MGPGVPDVTGERLPNFCRAGDTVYLLPMAYQKCDLSGLFGERTVTYFVSEGDVLLRVEEGQQVSPETIQPIGDWVLIQLKEPPEQRTAGGIILPDTAKERPPFAQVLRTGHGARVPGAAIHHILDGLQQRLLSVLSEEEGVRVRETIDDLKRQLRATVPPLVKEGDTVIIKPGSPIRVNLNDWGFADDYYLIPQGDCLAVVDQQNEQPSPSQGGTE